MSAASSRASSRPTCGAITPHLRRRHRPVRHEVRLPLRVDAVEKGVKSDKAQNEQMCPLFIRLRVVPEAARTAVQCQFPTNAVQQIYAFDPVSLAISRPIA